jgi:hypothetical protein
MKLNMGAMARCSSRVAAFAAIAAFLLQASCATAYASVPELESAGPVSACHESTPPPPDTPIPAHLCCSGEHSSGALVSSAVTPELPAFADVILNPVFDSTVLVHRFAGTAIASPDPPNLFALRI